MVKVLASATLLCVLMVLLGINRGFDITDEGLYVLLADPLQQNVAGIFNYDLFFKLIYQLTGYTFSLVELRFLRLISYLAGAWALMGFWKNVTGEPKPNPAVFWISCLGIFAGYGFLPPTISYNSITVVLVCFWLMLVSKPELAFKHLAFLGLLLAILVYAKITLAVLFFPLTFSMVIGFQKVRIPLSFVILLPIILFETVFLIVFKESALTRLAEGIPLNSQRSSYQLKQLLFSIAVGGFWITLPGTLFFGLGYLKRIKSRFFLGLLPLPVLVILWITSYTHITHEWNHLFLLSSAALFGFCLGWKGPGQSFPRIWAGALVLMPFALHFGSNVYWLRIGIHYWVFWLLAFFLAWDGLKRKPAVLISAFSVVLVFNGIWWQPFGQDKPLWTHKTPWNLGEKGGLLLDPQLAIITQNLKESLSEPAQKSVLAAYRVPGLMWLAGRQIPFSPGIWDKPQLNALFETKPEKMIFHNLESLPQNWSFVHQKEMGVFQGDTLRLLWD